MDVGIVNPPFDGVLLRVFDFNNFIFLIGLQILFDYDFSEIYFLLSRHQSIFYSSTGTGFLKLGNCLTAI